MNRYLAPKALDYSTVLLDGRRVSGVTPKSFEGGQHEALIGAEIVGYVDMSFDSGSARPVLVVRRKRPFIPCGTDPKLVNVECSRLFAIIPREIDTRGESFDVVEVTP